MAEQDPRFSDRVVTDVDPMPWEPLPHDKVFVNGHPNIDELKNHFLKEGLLSLEDATQIITMATELLKKEPNIIELEDPLTVCGDIHGQFYDLTRLLAVGGNPSNTQYLFLGDYVDRGCFSCEVVLFLYSMKINYPNTVFMLRGNHECRQLTQAFNFHEECLHKYTQDLYDLFMASFDVLPIAATINGKFLCVHGGLSPDIKTLNDIRNIHRFREPPRSGAMCDLLWSDPVENDDGSVPWFSPNDTRQCSYVFGYEAVTTFLKENNLLSIIRAHEAQSEGFKMHRDWLPPNQSHVFPSVITIFSAPNYCDVYNNRGAVLKFENNLLNIRQYNCVPHPYYLPNFMDVFTWSLPFVAEKVTEMLCAVMNSTSDDTSSGEEEETKQTEVRGRILKKKVMSVTKYLRMYRLLRQERDAIVQLKGLSPSQKVPLGLLSEGPEAIKKAISGFESARQADLVNEAMPPARENQ